MVDFTKIAQSACQTLPLYSLTHGIIRYAYGEKSYPFSKSFDLNSLQPHIKNVVHGLFVSVVYPYVARPFVIINACLGAVHLVIGGVQRFHLVDAQLTSDQGLWSSVALNIHKAVVHFLTAGYDFSVYYALQARWIGLPAFIGLSLVPAAVLQVHEKIFKKEWELPSRLEENIRRLANQLQEHLKEDTSWKTLKEALAASITLQSPAPISQAKDSTKESIKDQLPTKDSSQPSLKEENKKSNELGKEQLPKEENQPSIRQAGGFALNLSTFMEQHSGLFEEKFTAEKLGNYFSTTFSERADEKGTEKPLYQLVYANWPTIFTFNWGFLNLAPTSKHNLPAHLIKPYIDPSCFISRLAVGITETVMPIFNHSSAGSA